LQTAAQDKIKNHFVIEILVAQVKKIVKRGKMPACLHVRCMPAVNNDIYIGFRYDVASEFKTILIGKLQRQTRKRGTTYIINVPCLYNERMLIIQGIEKGLNILYTFFIRIVFFWSSLLMVAPFFSLKYSYSILIF